MGIKRNGSRFLSSYGLNYHSKYIHTYDEADITKSNPLLLLINYLMLLQRIQSILESLLSKFSLGHWL